MRLRLGINETMIGPTGRVLRRNTGHTSGPRYLRFERLTWTPKYVRIIMVFWAMFRVWDYHFTFFGGLGRSALIKG